MTFGISSVKIIFVIYRSIYYFKNVFISHNVFIDIYIMGMLLKYNPFGVNVIKTKYGMNLRQRADTMLSKQNVFCGT